MLTKVKRTKKIYLTAVSLLLVMPLLCIQRPARAAVLGSRDVVVSNSLPSAVTSHLFSFTIPGATPVASIQFEYCSNTPTVGGPCTAPAGLSLSAAVLSNQTGEVGFSIHGSSTVNNLIITRTSAPTTAGPVSYTFSSITNQSTNQSVYVRISTYASTDASGPVTDEGAVVYSTARGLGVDGFVPPYLTFCVGVSIAVNCATTTGSLLNFGEFTTAGPRFLTSEFSGSTNDPGGFSTSIVGQTMTSGNNIIPALNPPQASQPGVSQFGMNLRANTSPGVGADPVGPGTSNPVVQMNSPNLFFLSNQTVTNSPLPTDFTKFTASYIVNISSSQSPGIYSTTLTYIAVAAF